MSLQDIQDQQHIIMKQKSFQSGNDNLEKQKQELEQHVNNRSSTDEDQKNFYDKNISFFDRISCESNEKTQSKPKNWKEERKINAETFGLQQRQQNEMKQNYNRQYNNNQNSNYRNNGNSNYQSSQNGRSYPRNNYLNNSNSQQPQKYRSNQYGNQNVNSSSQRYDQRSTNNNNLRTGSGYTNTNNYRRNEMEVSSRRFGSR